MNDFIQSYGNLLAAAFSFIGSIFTIFVTYYINSQKTERRSIFNQMKRLTENLDIFKNATLDEHKKIAIEIQKMAGKIDSVAEKTEDLRDEQKKIEGRIDYQQKTVYDFMEKLNVINAKLALLEAAIKRKALDSSKS